MHSRSGYHLFSEKNFWQEKYFAVCKEKNLVRKKSKKLICISVHETSNSNVLKSVFTDVHRIFEGERETEREIAKIKGKF
ncbi:MAG: hypothetical protein EBS06_04930 [Proteobacteria bacterium]|nr:hypothetical protein [Pseudomonadota bacterium]